MDPLAEKLITTLRIPGGWYVREGATDEWEYCPAPDPRRD